jgi:hypothetical protein
MIPKIIHLVWLPIATDAVRHHAVDVERKNRGWDVYVWDGGNINDILEPWQWEHSTDAGASNVIRLHLLRLFGGIYCDTDFVHLKSFDEIPSFDSLSAFVAYQPDKQCLCNACFGAEPDHPWINAMIDNYGDQRLKDAAWGCHVMEPHLTPDVTILPTDTFYPYNWNGPPKPPTDATIAYHLWNGSWVEK